MRSRSPSRSLAAASLLAGTLLVQPAVGQSARSSPRVDAPRPGTPVLAPAAPSSGAAGLPPGSVAGVTPPGATPPAPTFAGRAFPSLPRAIELGRAHAPTAVGAQNELAIGRSQYAGAGFRQLGNPYLEVFVDRGNGGATKDLAVQGNLWLPLELSGQRGRRLAEVDSLVAWKTANAEAVQADVAGRVVTAFGNAVVANERVRTFESILTTSKSEAELYRARMVAGDATLRDAKLAEVEVARNGVTVAEARADLARALSEMEQLTGLEGLGAPSSDMPEPPRVLTGAEDKADQLAQRAPVVTASDKEADYFVKAKARQSLESHAPVNLILSAGRGDLGEARVGGGVSWTFPVLRQNQAEQARADAERTRAMSERSVRARVVTSVIRGLAREHEAVRAAIDEMVISGEPAAQASVDAAATIHRAGKGELLNVLIARRDLVLLKARRLELLRRDWQIAGEFVSISGDLPR